MNKWFKHTADRFTNRNLTNFIGEEIGFHLVARDNDGESNSFNLKRTSFLQGFVILGTVMVKLTAFIIDLPGLRLIFLTTCKPFEENHKTQWVIIQYSSITLIYIMIIVYRLLILET